MKELLENIHKFDWKELHGKQLRIAVGQGDEDGVEYVCVMGVDESTGHYYVLHTETKKFQ